MVNLRLGYFILVGVVAVGLGLSCGNKKSTPKPLSLHVCHAWSQSICVDMGWRGILSCDVTDEDGKTCKLIYGADAIDPNAELYTESLTPNVSPVIYSDSDGGSPPPFMADLNGVVLYERCVLWDTQTGLCKGYHRYEWNDCVKLDVHDKTGEPICTAFFKSPASKDGIKPIDESSVPTPLPSVPPAWVANDQPDLKLKVGNDLISVKGAVMGMGEEGTLDIHLASEPLSCDWIKNYTEYRLSVYAPDLMNYHLDPNDPGFELATKIADGKATYTKVAIKPALNGPYGLEWLIQSLSSYTAEIGSGYVQPVRAKAKPINFEPKEDYPREFDLSTFVNHPQLALSVEGRIKPQLCFPPPKDTLSGIEVKIADYVPPIRDAVVVPFTFKSGESGIVLYIADSQIDCDWMKRQGWRNFHKIVVWASLTVPTSGTTKPYNMGYAGKWNIRLSSSGNDDALFFLNSNPEPPDQDYRATWIPPGDLDVSATNWDIKGKFTLELSLNQLRPVDLRTNYMVTENTPKGFFSLNGTVTARICSG